MDSPDQLKPKLTGAAFHHRQHRPEIAESLPELEELTPRPPRKIMRPGGRR